MREDARKPHAAYAGSARSLTSIFHLPRNFIRGLRKDFNSAQNVSECGNSIATVCTSPGSLTQHLIDI